MRLSARWMMVVWTALLFAFSADGQDSVSKITIHSSWGGLGPHADSTIIITRRENGYSRDGQAVAAGLVDALVAAIREPIVSKPDLAKLGVTQGWLLAYAKSQEPHANNYPGDPTAGQRALFQNSFTNMNLIARVLPELFRHWHTDDYPGVQVEVIMGDNSRLVAFSSSQFAYMLPWRVGPDKKPSYNPAIAHAIAVLMPEKAANRQRLSKDDLAGELAEAVMNEIETAYDLLGVDDRVGGDVARLRSVYKVTAATIDPYLRPEYGPREYDATHEEINLHATLHKASFPAQVSDEVTLQEVKGHIQGVELFLASAGKYENLVLSVPWLKQYILSHPKTLVRVTYVHEASLGDQALGRFAADMKVHERNDLVQKVKAQQKEIALIQVGVRYAEAYWLVFPDKHMALWRYEGPSGLLKWKPSDFGEGECDGLGINNGGCSGREIAPDGTLVSEGTPRDVACVQAWRAQHAESGRPANAPLFDVMEHGRGGFIDGTGAVAIPLCFETVGDFSEGLASFERDGRWGYINATGNVVIQPVFPWAAEFHEGLAQVQVTGSALGLDGRWGFIDKTGAVVIQPTYHRSAGDEGGDFHEGLARVEIDDDRFPPRKGFIDHTGKLVIPARFTYVYPFSEGLAAATEAATGESGWGYIDKSGKWAIAPQFEGASIFELGLAPVKRKLNCEYIDKSGAPILQLEAPAPPEDCASAWGNFTDGLSRWRFGSRYGFIDRTGTTVVAARFDLTFGFSEGLAAVRIGKQWGFIDTSGAMVIPLRDLFDVKPFHNGLAEAVVEHGGRGYIDRTGKFVWGPHEQEDKDGDK